MHSTFSRSHLRDYIKYVVGVFFRSHLWSYTEYVVMLLLVRYLSIYGKQLLYLIKVEMRFEYMLSSESHMRNTFFKFHL